MSTENKKQETEKNNDPFSPENLCLSQNYGENYGSKKILTTIPVHKPRGEDFIRTWDCAEMCITAAMAEFEREIYIVKPDMMNALGKDAKPRLLIPSITATANFFLWPLKVTLPGEKNNPWNLTAHAAALTANKRWIRISSNQSAQSYDVFEALGNIPEPEWPSITLGKMLELAFKDRFIQSEDHPVVKKLKGIL